MPKKNKSNLGHALIKDQKTSRKGRRVGSDSMLHTADLSDGYDWGRLNLQSVTEESSLQAFLSTAELAGLEFEAEKLNIKFVNPNSNVGLLTASEKKITAEKHEKNKYLLKIPRRPKWTSETKSEELHQKEQEVFLEWRRQLANLIERDNILLTPYEKNLEFWRQLWRVVERSDVIVQIVDARNPLLFRCDDLEAYVKEVSKEKVNLILINKADFLTQTQRKIWADYFSNQKIRVAFFSAVLETEKYKNENSDSDGSNSENESDEFETCSDGEDSETERENQENVSRQSTEKFFDTVENCNVNDDAEAIVNSPELLTCEKLIDLFKTIYKGHTHLPDCTTIGLVGYPNVGKSSTINALIQEKKVSVSATPGKTKHFQTLYLDNKLMLCDCPGLVMPSFVYTKAEMIINGILPIDQMRDHVPAVNLVATLIPRHVLEDKYGIMIPKPVDEDDETRPPFAEEVLNAYGFLRGFMTANGQPDNARSARYILKDFVSGKLLYCHAPPGIDQDVFHTFPEKQRSDRILPPREARAIKLIKTTPGDIDKYFFKNMNRGVHAKGVTGKYAGLPSVGGSKNSSASISQNVVEKPWKTFNKHVNKKKREKTRRLYSFLDEH